MAKRRKADEARAEARQKINPKSKPSSSKGAPRAKTPGLRAKIGTGSRMRPSSPLERANELALQAMETPNPERQFKLATQALDLSEDCADAYVILSRFVEDGREALELLERGLAAGQRVVDMLPAAEIAGHYWLVLETRPYLRAHLAVSECLWSLGRPEESVEHLQEMLRPNPGDNQGVRYLLAAHLLDLDRDVEFDDLVKNYDEPSTFLQFSKVLREYRRSGDSPAARQALAAARRSNKFVVPLLLDTAPPDGPSTDLYSPGDPNEARVYIDDFGGGWKHTPGAVTWLRNMAGQDEHKSAKPPTGPTAAVKKQLTALPQSYGTIWQASVNRVSTWLREGGRLVRPWSILIVNYTDHLIIGQELVTDEPGPDVLFDHVAKTMRKPSAGQRHRPSEIQVRDEPAWNAVQPHLQEIGVDLIYRTELDEADFILGELQQVMQPEGQPPALTETADFHSAQGARYYAAAAKYFRSAPWRRVPADSMIAIDCPQLREFGSGRWYAVVMGQAGQTLGLALYSDKSAIEDICCGGGCSMESVGRGATALSMLFSEAFEVPVPDMQAAETHHWELAGPEAWPFILCADGGHDVRHMEPWEFQLLTGCVEAIPDFIRQHPYPTDLPAAEGPWAEGSESARPEASTAPAFEMVASNLKFTLSWVDLDRAGCDEDCDHCE